MCDDIQRVARTKRKTRCPGQIWSSVLESFVLILYCTALCRPRENGASWQHCVGVRWPSDVTARAGHLKITTNECESSETVAGEREQHSQNARDRVDRRALAATRAHLFPTSTLAYIQMCRALDEIHRAQSIASLQNRPRSRLSCEDLPARWRWLRVSERAKSTGHTARRRKMRRYL